MTTTMLRVGKGTTIKTTELKEGSGRDDYEKNGVERVGEGTTMTMKTLKKRMMGTVMTTMTLKESRERDHENNDVERGEGKGRL